MSNNFSLRVRIDEHTCEEVLLQILAQEVARIRPRMIVECGSGVSTLVMAKALHSCGLKDSRIIALEHEEVYQKRTKAWLSHEKVDEYAKVLLAPIGPGGWFLAEQAGLWTSGAWSEAGLGAARIDLLFVDGPPRPYSREPAIQYFRPWLQLGAVVIVPDLNKDRTMFARWRVAYPEMKASEWETDRGAGCLEVPETPETDA